MDTALTRLVWQRAKRRCEYCQLPQEADDRPFEIDHIRSRKHRGPTLGSNLALSCFRCSSFKGSDISSLDDHTRKLTPLFNPRRHKWANHFRWEGPIWLVALRLAGSQLPCFTSTTNTASNSAKC
jgi:5-methylcytosine-specific restriction endonuclease McrA